MSYARKEWAPEAQGPLRGLRVVDLSRLVAGNMLTLQLADFGADVVKVEPPEGDPLRAWQEEGLSLFWAVYGRNKRSVALDLRRDPDRAALWALIDGADALVESYRPGTLEAMGYAPSALLARNPDLVVVRISGFGQTGPYAGLPGFGTLVEGMSGYAHRSGFPDREPVLPPIALADMIAGLQGAMAVLVALRARDQGLARGQVIDLSLLEPIFATLGPEAAIHALTGNVKGRMGSASNTASPRNVYACADGRFVSLSGSTPGAARRIFEVIGRPEMNDDPRFATNAARLAHRDLVDGALRDWFAGRDRDAALAQMRGAGATVGPIYSIADVAEDPHFREREVIVTLDDPDLGPVPTHSVAPRLDATPGTLRRPAPRLGEHAREVLAEAGLDEAAIAAVLGARP